MKNRKYVAPKAQTVIYESADVITSSLVTGDADTSPKLGIGAGWGDEVDF